jgi:hypothetical protein
MKQLSEQMSRLQVDRPELESEPKSWEIVERCLNDLEYWCETQAKNLAELDYDQKRLALFALKLKARVWRSDHDPRFENKMRIDVANEDRSGHAIVDTTPRRGGCTPRSRRARPPSEAGSRARSRPRDRRTPRDQAPQRRVAARTRSAARETSETVAPLRSFRSPQVGREGAESQNGSDDRSSIFTYDSRHRYTPRMCCSLPSAIADSARTSFRVTGYCRAVPVFSMGPRTAQSTAIKKRSQGKKRTILFM